MPTPLRIARNLVERFTGYAIYRNPLPHGSDLFRDLSQVKGWGPPLTLFDIGANEGWTTNRLRIHYPNATVHAFEPASSNVDVLRRLFASDSNIMIHSLALGNSDGNGVLHLGDMSTTHSLVHADQRTGSESVIVLTMDTFCESHGISRVNYCKIDTEGADLEVLRGATGMLTAQLIDFVQVETTIRRETDYFVPFQEIDDFLTELGYEVFGFYEQQMCWSGRDSLLFFNPVYVRSSLVDGLPVR